MARAVSPRRKAVTTLIAWTVGLLIFFPIFWTVLTSFKPEAQAIAMAAHNARPRAQRNSDAQFLRFVVGDRGEFTRADVGGARVAVGR